MERCEEVFISYAREDASWRDEFVQMLAPAQERGLIRVWSDERIAAGEEWSRSIEEALARAKVGLLLVSGHFLNSPFITRVELTKLLDAAGTGRVGIRWVPVSSSLFGVTPLRDLQACCDPQKPLDTLSKAQRRVVIQRVCVQIVEEFGIEPSVSRERRDALRERVQKRLKRLGEKYILGDVVGSGKFSIVYRAEKTRPKRVVAVKVLVASELDDWARRLFVEGVQRANDLTSPAFIRIFNESIEDPEFLVTEFVEGEPLSRVLNSHPHGLPLDRVKKILRALVTATEEAHERGFRRGEIRPSDILLEPSGRPRLSSFDFTNVLREHGQISSNFLLDRESLSYMSPERYFGHEPTERTDQYSLGLLATELLGGTRIPAVVRPRDLEVKRRLFAKLESGDGDWAKRSADFRALVCRMLRIKPSERWPTMSKVHEMLSSIDVSKSPEEVNRTMASASYLRIQLEQRFFEKLYDNLFAALPDVRAHFAAMDMKRQYVVLNDAIHTLLAYRRDCSADRTTLETLAARHTRFGLTECHYRMFREALVRTLADFGEAPAVLEAWRSTVTPGLEYMWTRQEQEAPSRAAGTTG
jgi:serine/threonine protein kinase